jgi:hypothetical protein
MPAPALQVTLLFTDIEGSTALWERDETRMSQALALHDALARSSVESRGGSVVKQTGDGIHAVFDDRVPLSYIGLATSAHDSAVGGGAPLRVAAGCIGVVEHRDGDYFSSTVNRAARIMSAAHGGQYCCRRPWPVAYATPSGASVAARSRSRKAARPRRPNASTGRSSAAASGVSGAALAETTPNNLPLQPTTFIGRDKELTG